MELNDQNISLPGISKVLYFDLGGNVVPPGLAVRKITIYNDEKKKFTRSQVEFSDNGFWEELSS